MESETETARLLQRIAKTQREEDERIATFRREYEERIAKLQREHEERVAKLQQESDQRVAEVQREKDKRVAEVQREKVAELEQRDREKDELVAEFEQKEKFEYWHKMDEVWFFELDTFDGCYEAKLALRQQNTPEVYSTIHGDLMNEEGVETILQDDVIGGLFSLTGGSTVVTIDSHDYATRGEGNRSTKASTEKKLLKNFLGRGKGEGDLSKAHAFPNDKDCNKFWWPMLLMVTGLNHQDFHEKAMEKLSAMSINKITFPGPHNHIYDDLKKGCVCTIPIFESMEELAVWQYKQGYEMLIVCDSVNTYGSLRMPNDKIFPHIKVATLDDVKKATALVAEMTKVLADSLVTNWEKHYEKLDDVGGRKESLSLMKTILTKTNNNQVFIPCLKGGLTEPKLYKIDYRTLYSGDEEGMKYIHDPFPALIKSAVNLSAFINKARQVDKNKKSCKLLPACACLRDNDSVSSDYSSDSGILDLPPKVPSLVGLHLREIEIPSSNIVSDDECEGHQDTNDDTDVDDGSVKSVLSDLTGG